MGKDVRAHVKTRMMKALDRGERDEVLRLWENFVPPLVLRTDRNSQKLEFYLNIFFAIYPVHPVNPSRKTSALAPAMGRFKEFLEGDGAPLAVTPEFLAYHAMPYVPEIAAHPSFKDLFTKEWAAALKTRLSEYLAASEQFAATPRLLEICGLHRGLGVQQTEGRHPVDRAHGELQALKDRLVESELRALESKQQLAAHEAAYCAPPPTPSPSPRTPSMRSAAAAAPRSSATCRRGSASSKRGSTPSRRRHRRRLRRRARRRRRRGRVLAAAPGHAAARRAADAARALAAQHRGWRRRRRRRPRRDAASARRPQL